MLLFNLIQSPYHLIDAVVYFIATAVPVYFIVKSRKSVNNPFRKIMAILAGFLLVQAIYHIAAGMFDQNLLSKVILEPLSAAVLVSAALVYLFTRGKMLRKEVGNSVGS